MVFSHNEVLVAFLKVCEQLERRMPVVTVSTSCRAVCRALVGPFTSRTPSCAVAGHWSLRERWSLLSSGPFSLPGRGRSEMAFGDFRFSTKTRKL